MQKAAELLAISDIPMNEIADMLGFEDALYFSKKFKSCFGCTPTDYVNNLRIERAKALLKTGELSISQIASELGFCETSHFSNFFKSKTGLSPAYYRHLNLTAQNKEPSSYEPGSL